MSDNGATHDSEQAQNKDPSQTTAPPVETSVAIFPEWIPILGKLTFGNFWLAIPTAISGFVSLLFVLAGAWIPSLFFGAMALLFGVAAGIVAATTAWHSTPMQRARDWLAYLALTRSMPWSYHDSLAAEVHGVEEVYDDGTLETTDGRFLRFVRAEGVNTNGLDVSELDDLAAQLSRGVDEKANDIPINYYSTTADFDPEEIVGHYLDAAESDHLAGRALRFVREMYQSLYDWYVDVDGPSWEANYWQHYVVAEVSVDEVSSATSDDSSTVRRIFWPPTVRNISIEDRRAMTRELNSRERLIRTEVIGAVPDATPHTVGAAEAISLVSSYWGDEATSPPRSRTRGDNNTISGPNITLRSNDELEEPSHVDQLAFAGDDEFEEADDDDSERSWPSPLRPVAVLMNRLPYVGSSDDGERVSLGVESRDTITPDGFETNRSHTTVGGQYAKTFWIAKWSQDAQSVFLRELLTMRGKAEIDVKIYNDPLPKQQTIQALKYDVRDIIKEAKDTGDELSEMELGDDKETYAKLYRLFRETSTHPWSINGYITVRVTDEMALAAAEEEGIDIEETPVSTIKRRVLEDAAKDVKKVAEGHPADLSLVEHRERRKECFIAGSPTGPDEYSRVSAPKSRVKNTAGRFISEGINGLLESNKVTLGAGGAVGAMLPWCSATVLDEDAPLWGRNEQNGSPLLIDPFNRGSAPHLLTVGKSRHGKTYSASAVAKRWYNQRDDRTLIVCDTQSGFAGLTEDCDGEHVIVDGSRTINPLHVEPPEDMNRTNGDASVLQMKVEEVAEFFRSALIAQGVESPSDYTSDLEDMALKAYRDAGIEIGEPETLSKPSPDINDMLSAGAELIHNAEERSISGHESEVTKKEERLGELLNYLSGFSKGGKYHDLLGVSESGRTDVEPAEQAARQSVTVSDGGEDNNSSGGGMGIGLDDPDTDMVYLDLKQFRRHDDIDKSVMLQLLLGQITQRIRSAPGETIFMVDEAHVLYHSEPMVRWMEKASREWARYGAALWNITQHPSEVLGYEGIEGAEVIKDQVSTTQIFQTPGVSNETLRRLGGKSLAGLGGVVRSGLRTGKDNEDEDLGEDEQGYSECLISLHDQRGWIRTRVEVSEYEHYLLTHDPAEREHNFGGAS